MGLNWYTIERFSSSGLVDDEAYAIEPALDNKPYTALVYGNGPGWKSIRENLTGVDTGKFLRSHRTCKIIQTHCYMHVSHFLFGQMSYTMKRWTLAMYLNYDCVV